MHLNIFCDCLYKFIHQHVELLVRYQLAQCFCKLLYEQFRKCFLRDFFDCFYALNTIGILYIEWKKMKMCRNPLRSRSSIEILDYEDLSLYMDCLCFLINWDGGPLVLTEDLKYQKHLLKERNRKLFSKRKSSKSKQLNKQPHPFTRTKLDAHHPKMLIIVTIQVLHNIYFFKQN